jgi:hypothetical protein
MIFASSKVRGDDICFVFTLHSLIRDEYCFEAQIEFGAVAHIAKNFV